MINLDHLIGLVAVLLTSTAIAMSHVYWENKWWRTPFLWTDRWHILSALSYWPACALILWKFAGEWIPSIVAVISANLLWQVVKAIGQRDWEPGGMQFYRWLRRK